MINQINIYKEKEPLINMERSFYLYRITFDKTSPLNLIQVFSKDKIKDNIAEIQLSEDEKKKFILVIDRDEGSYLHGYFFKLKDDFEINIFDKQQGVISVARLSENNLVIEKSHFIYDKQKSTILGEYNDSGVRFFQNPLEEYLKKRLKREDIKIEIIYNHESYENLEEKEIKYFNIKIAKPKLNILQELFEMSDCQLLNEASSNDPGFFIELKVKAGYKKSLDKTFFKKVIEKFRAIRDPQGIKKFEVRELNSDKSLELIKDKILRKKIDIDGNSEDDIFSRIISTYEDLDLEEIFGDEEN